LGGKLDQTFEWSEERYIAEIATQQITNDLTKLIAGILIGLLAGMGVGLLVKRI